MNVPDGEDEVFVPFNVAGNAGETAENGFSEFKIHGVLGSLFHRYLANIIIGMLLVETGFVAGAFARSVNDIRANALN